ncbi:GreA/GreB family elongation factor [Hydrogenophaga crocea]|uniref:Transcription elongation factor GreAB n=1 Tax=Hydrogenophaga crocea TaxID=2716225 RepID=A0A6G8ICL9_9BURK|nr:GreA/GreB family elongation factor [Hydrogenophaga crocea]QIM50927.1 transcription elongation factor GreAB [Hydrogenophaga crocea]
MTPISFAERTLTELDHVRLERLRRQGEALRVGDLLDLASVVPSREVAPDVVTMYSQVLVHEGEGEGGSAEPRRLTLCYPADAEPGTGFISVLSPVGLALLGLRVGEVARWSGPDGQPRAATIAALLFQPEASGDYTT